MILRTLWRTAESLVSRALVRTARSAWLIRIAVARFAASNGNRGSLLQPATAKVHKAKPTKPLRDPDILVMNFLTHRSAPPCPANDLPLSRERRARCSLYLDRPVARRLQRPVSPPLVRSRDKGNKTVPAHG